MGSIECELNFLYINMIKIIFIKKFINYLIFGIFLYGIIKKISRIKKKKWITYIKSDIYAYIKTFGIHATV